MGHSRRSPAPRCPVLVAVTNGASRRNLGFSFNRRHVQTLRCTVYSRKALRGPGARPPIAFAHVDLDRIKEMRCEMFLIPDRMRRYESVLSLSRLRRKKATPKEPLHDPYIVAIIIAMAQENDYRATVQQYSLMVRRAAYNKVNTLTELIYSSIQSQILVSTSDKRKMHLYRAPITSSLLRSLDDPSFVPSEPTSIPVQITTIRINPYRTLRHRLTALLLSEDDLTRIQEAKAQGLECPCNIQDAKQ